MKKDNIIADKSYQFALRAIKLHKYLTKEKKEFYLSGQVIRSGTSIGANVEEAISGQSEKDFLSKLSISYKEARETTYWLRLLRDSEYLEPKLAESLIADCEEMKRIIGSIQITLKKRKGGDKD